MPDPTPPAAPRPCECGRKAGWRFSYQSGSLVCVACGDEARDASQPRIRPPQKFGAPDVIVPPPRPVSPEAAPPRATTPPMSAQAREDYDEPDFVKYEERVDDSHALGVDGCEGCGATAMDDLMRPCPNVRCRECAELNGLHSPGCATHRASLAPSRESGALLKRALDARALAAMDQTDRAYASADRARAALDRHLSTLERDAARMREALEFYADPKTWKFPRPGSTDGITLSDWDLGNRARAALTPSGEPTTTPETRDASE